ncbi:response regulator [Pseudomonas sp. CCM 7891]|uniref:Response regulator n=1 Tax=Pseudomonas karstica TaxID=1055468 RepID=A0A7X2RVN9_9PSED|nr:response regulator [Pseudomonas karstica]
MSNDIPYVFVVDDDISIRESLEALISCAGWRPETFASAQSFLDHPRPRSPSCLLLDLNLPDLSGLDLQLRIAADRADMPIIFITGCGDVPRSVQAMKAGAFDFLVKPFGEDVLLSVIEHAIQRSHSTLDHDAELQVLRASQATLTRREHEVMGLVVAGLLNKHIGVELHISEITVKAHRGKVMRKMKATSLPDLVNKVTRLRAAAGARR